MKQGAEVYSAERSAQSDRRKFVRLQFLRALLTALITLFLAQTVDFGIGIGGLLLAGLGGTLLAGAFLRRNQSLLKILTGHALVLMVIWLFFSGANYLATLPEGAAPSMDFLVPLYADDFFLISLFYGVSFLFTWFFWTRSGAVTVEATLFALTLLWLLAGHRNYHIDAPREIASLAWKVPLFQQLHAEPQHLLLALGVGFTLLLAVYFVLANNRPLFGKERVLKAYGPRQKVIVVLCPLVLLASLFYYAKFINSRYSADLSRAANGVGSQQDVQEGDSNLGFHSAISPTKQPSALVRLEGDFQNNPWAPMLYLREGALSGFSGQELVYAGASYDTDVPNVLPGQPFLSMDEELDPNREKVTQSIYLLTDHKAPFALDIPRRISMIKNPYPERFRLTYQALSYAPTKKLEELVGTPVGDPEWDQNTWEHYLRAPGSHSLAAELSPGMLEEALHAEEPVLDEHGEDLRYLALARALSSGQQDSVLKAASVIQYLSDNSIYTRQPGHQVTNRGDPVAPYLFADKKRGYCVHFAHAASYLLRLIGVPTRIATGYLVDLTYSKDGHILLHLGDRHAWPEVYVQGHGWIVFDITPAEAENEQALVPDENLLEDLMSKLDPAQELLEPIPVEAGSTERNKVLAQLLTSQNLLLLLVGALLSWIMIKWWMRNSYRFAGDDRTRVRRAYSSFASLMTDSGIYRYQGETRQEYADRLQKRGVDSALITAYWEKAKYGSDLKADEQSIREALEIVQRSYDGTFSRLRRILLFFSPLSLSRWRSW